MEDQQLFYSFLSAYSDCEGNWNFTKSHGKHLRVTFRLRTGDKEILDQIKEKLESMGFGPLLTLEIKAGTKSPMAKFNFNIFNLTLNKKKDVNRFINKLLPFSKHTEKIRKMTFVLENRGKTWDEIEDSLNQLKEEIKQELLKN